VPDLAKSVKRMQRALDLPVGVSAPSISSLNIAPAKTAAPRLVAVASVPEPRESRGQKPAAQVAAASNMPRGTIKFFDTKRGFGFIDHGTGTDLFVHHSNLDVAGHRLTEGQAVEFEIGEGRRGEEARKVRLARVG